MSEHDLPVSNVTDTFEDSIKPVLNQSCPSWIKISEIPHPAMVPGFISRRECLPDGSIDPNTPSLSTQMTLLQASTLSPSLSSVLGNIPSGLMCESIHKKVFKDVKESLEFDCNEFVITHPPGHYSRTLDDSSISSMNSMTMANQTASELATMNILYGGVKGKAYLDSLKTFIDGVHPKADSQINLLMRKKLEKAESVCGFKVFNPPNDLNNSEIKKISDSFTFSPSIDDHPTTTSPSHFLLLQNHQICKLLNTSLSPDQRQDLLEKLNNNLMELMRECPEEVKKDKFKGVKI